MKYTIPKILLALCLLSPAAQAKPSEPEDIKAYCLDFNWAGRRKLAEPGSWNNADPAALVSWAKTMGANVIQTFCVSTNGYAYYKHGVVPEQPGLKHDFLPETVKLGHAEGMMVFGYFTIGCNPRWGQENPEYAYPTKPNEGTYHIPYTDAYLDYLSAAITDAVSKTGIDGFMVDWLWQPKRITEYSGQGRTVKHPWLDSEKKLYEQLMGEKFPGADQLTSEQDTAYSRKSIDRCWKTIRSAAKKANPDCIIWLTVNKITHPHVVDSDMYKEVDWLMNEAGDMKRIEKVKEMVGDHTRLITCLAFWNGADAMKVVPQALDPGVGLYGFAKPRNGIGTIPLAPILTNPVSDLKGDDRNIAMLARAYYGVPSDAAWTPEKGFTEP